MTSAVGLDMGTNLSFFMVPAALAMCWAPHVYGAVLAGKAYDNANPRAYRDRAAKSETLDKATLQRIVRAENASLNGFETLGFFASAVVAANVAGLPRGQLNALSVGYVVSRAVYNVVYIGLQTNRRIATLRSLTWLAGVGLGATLWIRAGLALARAP